MLNRDQIVAASKTRKVATYTVAGLGEVGLRVMTGTEREAWESQCFKDGKTDLEHFRAKLLAKTLCDADGVRLFSDDDIATVSELDAPVLIALYGHASTLNALTTEDVDELTKN